MDRALAAEAWQRGVALLERSAPRKAIAEFDEALRLDPTHAKSHHQRGRALTGIGRLTASRQHLELAIALLDPIAPIDAERARDILNRVRTQSPDG